MTERNRKEAAVQKPVDQHITHILQKKGDARQRSPEELRALLGSSPETVEIKVMSELQLVSRVIGH